MTNQRPVLPWIAGREELFCERIAVSKVFTKLLLQLRRHGLDGGGGGVHRDGAEEGEEHEDEEPVTGVRDPGPHLECRDLL